MSGDPTGWSDRDFQDAIIRFLSGPQNRSSNLIDFPDERQREGAQRFARFLARRYYRDRLQRGFRYAVRLTGSPLEPLIEGPQFDAILDDCVLGSLQTARCIGRLAVENLAPRRTESWWTELLEYEFAWFQQLAASEIPPTAPVPAQNSIAVVRDFKIRIPELVARLKSGTMPAASLESYLTLLFSRTTHGRIYVVEMDQAAKAVFEAVDGERSEGEIARSSGLALEDTRRILTNLCELGAVILPPQR
jgi:hypothetical protein